MKKLVKLIILTSILLDISCMNDDALWENQEIPKIRDSIEGLFIINEGNFMYNNASLSYYDIAKKKVYNNVFFNSNSIPLGDVAQSMKIKDSLGYIIINNSGKIYIININNFKLKGKITGLTSPRHIHFVSKTKAYVTDLYSKSISIVNLETLQIIGYIDVNNHSSNFYQHPTEEMVRYKKYIFVNCWSYDDKILIINSQTDELIDSIEVPIQPLSMVIDKFNMIWVLTDGGFEGNPYGHEKPALVKINAQTRKIERTIYFELDDNPKDIALNGSRDTLFFINNDIYFLPVTDNSEPKLLIKSPYENNFSGGFYALTVDSVSSEIYVADAIDLVQNGVIYRYKPDAMQVDTFKTGIIPGNFCFKNN